MNTLISVIETALPVFLALGLGTLCRQRSFLSRDNVDALKKVVLNITLPAVLLNAFASAEYSTSTVILPVLVFLLSTGALGLGFLLLRLFGSKSRLAPFTASGFEAGMLGYALFALLFPQVSVSKFAILDLGQTLFVFTLFKILLSGRTDLKTILKDMASTPILWAVATGVLIGVTGLYGALADWGIQGIFTGTAEFIAAPTGMVILLTVGYDLVPSRIPWKKTGGLILMRLVIMAAVYGVTVLLNRTLLNGIIFEGAMLLMCILPPPYVIPVFADEPEERVYIASSLSAMTFVTILLFAVCSVLFAV